MRYLKLTALALMLVYMIIFSAHAASLYWEASSTSVAGYHYTSNEITTMPYNVYIDLPNPIDNTGRSDLTLSGTWYYIGATSSGVTQWPSDNQIAELLISYGLDGQPVRFTVIQIFYDPDRGSYYDSNPAEPYTYTGLEGIPNLVAPGGFATGIMRPVMFSWSDVPSATNYNLQVATDVGFTNLVIDVETADTEYEADVGELLPDTSYFWRVRAYK